MNAIEAMIWIGLGGVGFLATLALLCAMVASVTSHEIEEFHARRELAQAQEVDRVLDLGVADEAEEFLAGVSR